MSHKILREESGGERSSKQDRSKKNQSGRRQWSDAQKKQIVEEALSPGMSVSQVSRQYDLNANMIFRWMREMGRKKALKSYQPNTQQRMVPVGMIGGMIGDAPSSFVARDKTIEIAFANGTTVKAFGGIGLSEFSALLDLVRGGLR